ncbi:M28 family peptidase [Acaryochloris sp. IP29b_bin.148]|uniref:M28 family peptidase n=1 Tax=Acaryochloris sp. IP29b_bin.148 TaxID=2969218 RepID=UPI00260B8ED9|nr:M28 family peptidase [Acaryochloris sp. IP29b_bin.148]
MSNSTQETPIQERLALHLAHLVRERDPYLATEGHFYAKTYIAQELSQFGTVHKHPFQTLKKYANSIHENLILSLPGTQPLPPILIGAHFDTVPGSPGADDNASGLVVLLELARYFYHHPARYPLQIIAFDLEEYGCLGSQAYAQDLKRNQTRITTMMSLEMLGYTDQTPHSQNYPAGLEYLYPSTGNFIALLGNLRSIPTMFKLSHHLKQQGAPCEWLPVPFRGTILPDTRRSDHASFWDQGYAALMVTDTANLRNPHYHQPSDTLDTLDLDFLEAVYRGLVQALRWF